MIEQTKLLGKVTLTCNGLWDSTKAYDRLSMVYDSNSKSYISIIDVPIGIGLTNKNYWQPLYSLVADNEDLTVNSKFELKFADKKYQPGEFSGYGREYLRKNIVNGKNQLTNDMISKSNTIYHIQYDYDLNGQTINFQQNSILVFEGGSISNGGINFNDVIIVGIPIFKNITIFSGNLISGNTTFIHKGTTANRPILKPIDAGFMYYDLTIGGWIWWTGTEWRDIVGGEGPQGPQGPAGPKGDTGRPFSISKIYSSVSDMEADFKSTSVKVGEFVIINTNDTTEEDNAKLYVKGDTNWIFIVDMSGMSGIEGPQGEQGIQGIQGPIGPVGPQGPQGTPGKDGADGKDGLPGKDALIPDSKSFVFKKGTGSYVTPPATPEVGDGRLVPVGWKDYPDETGIWWMSTGTVSGVTGKVTFWSTPQLSTGIPGTNGIDGVDGETGNYIDLMYAKSDSRNTPPPLDKTQRKPEGWSDQPVMINPNEVLWMIKAMIKPSTDKLVSTWSDPVIISGENGADGTTPNWNVFVFKKSISKPTRPNSTNPLPSGWEDVPTSDGVWWMSTNIVNGMTGLVDASKWSEPVKVVGEDGQNGNDGSHYAYIYKTEATQPATPTEQKVPPTGWSITPTAVTNTTFLWMSQTIVTGLGAVGTWSTPIRISGLNGENGADGKDIEFIYKRTDSGIVPTTPTTSQEDHFVPDGWTDHPQGVSTSMMYEWVSIRTKTNGKWSTFSTPAIWSKWGEKGMDGDGYEYIYKRTENTTAPTKPDTKQQDKYVPEGWTDNPVGVNTQYLYEWVCVRKKVNGVWSDFSIPAIWAKYGQDGGYWDFKYKLGDSSETQPDASIWSTIRTQRNPAGWVDAPPVVSGNKYLWMTKAFIDEDNKLTGVWADPVRINGVQGPQGETGPTGPAGPQGASGTPGVGYEMRYAIGTKDSTISLKDDTARTPEGWTLMMPPTTTDKPYIWFIQARIINNSLDGVWSAPSRLTGVDGINGVAAQYTEVRFGQGTLTTYYPLDITVSEPVGWRLTSWQPSEFQEGYSYNWYTTARKDGDNNLISYWNEPIRFDSADGVPGTPGEDGKTTYTWIMYADDQYGAGISNNPTGKSYIGLAYNKPTQVESTDPKLYAWSLIKGTDGVPGEPGKDGQPTYTWIQYADYLQADGYPPRMYQQPTTTTNYIGIAVNKLTQVEGSNVRDYTWSLFKGADGVTPNWKTFIFKQSVTKPDKPTGDALLPLGWYDVPTSDGIWWMSTGIVDGPTNKVTSWSDVTKVTGTDGQNGIRYVYIYKTSSTKPSTPTSTDIPPTGWSLDPTEISANTYTWMSQSQLDENGLATTWSTPIRLTGAQGEAGKDGTDIEFIYRLSDTGDPLSHPASVQQDGYVPSGWTDNPSGVGPTLKYEFVCVRYKIDGVWSQYSNPAIWSKYGEKGQDGDGYEYIYQLTIENFPPAKPNGTQADDYVPSGWTDNPTGVSTEFPYEWVSTRKKKSGLWRAFTEPALWAKLGNDGSYQEFRYTIWEWDDVPELSKTTPSPDTPTVTWYLQPPLPTTDKPGLWMTSATLRNADTLISEWTTPVRINGENGSQGNMVEFRFTNMNKLFTDEKAKGRIAKFKRDPSIWQPASKAQSWMTSLPTETEGYKIWQSFATIQGADDTLIGEWAEPVPYNGQDGITLYTWTAVSTDTNFASNAIRVEDSVLGTKYMYIGYMFNQLVPEDPREPKDHHNDYQWMKIGGEDGETGKKGQTVYPAGVYSIVATYITDEKTAPYVLDPLDGNYYVLNTIMTWKHQEQGHNPSQDNGLNWVKFEAFEAVYSKIIMADQALIGGFVYNGDLMFSQKGVNESGQDTSAYQNFEFDTTTNRPTTAFTPNFWLDGKEGNMEINRGTFRGKIINVSTEITVPTSAAGDSPTIYTINPYASNGDYITLKLSNDSYENHVSLPNATLTDVPLGRTYKVIVDDTASQSVVFHNGFSYEGAYVNQAIVTPGSFIQARLSYNEVDGRIWTVENPADFQVVNRVTTTGSGTDIINRNITSKKVIHNPNVNILGATGLRIASGSTFKLTNENSSGILVGADVTCQTSSGNQIACTIDISPKYGISVQELMCMVTPYHSYLNVGVMPQIDSATRLILTVQGASTISTTYVYLTILGGNRWKPMNYIN